MHKETSKMDLNQMENSSKQVKTAENGCLPEIKSKIIYKRWTSEENQIYVDFLAKYKEGFCTKESRKSKKVFKRLSSIIGTKTPTQCKSHHQKKFKCFHSIKKIISKFSK